MSARSDRPFSLVTPKEKPQLDFTDTESQRVLTAAAHAIMREIGRQFARDYVGEMTARPKGPR